MRTHSTTCGLAPADRGASVAMGNFDGVHLGHQAVMALPRGGRLWRALGRRHLRAAPAPVLCAVAPPFRLMNAEARAHRLEKLGVEQLYELPFDASLARMDAETFVREVLVGGLWRRHVMVGADFRFGKGAQGSAETLRRWAKGTASA